ncbi:MAG: helix-turn-helix transcriptional regulator [Ruminococcus sp.]|nr:helix-turn-helix transcriptional regulator [Ruminococcus sp.]
MTDISLQEEVEIFVKSRKMLKKDFADKIGITPVMLSHWLKGRVSLNRKTLEKIVTEIDK